MQTLTLCYFFKSMKIYIYPLTITLLITAGFITGGAGISLFNDTCLTGIL